MTAAFFTALTVTTQLQVRLLAADFILCAVAMVLAGCGGYLVLRSRPKDRALGMPIVRPVRGSVDR